MLLFRDVGVAGWLLKAGPFLLPIVINGGDIFEPLNKWPNYTWVSLGSSHPEISGVILPYL